MPKTGERMEKIEKMGIAVDGDYKVNLEMALAILTDEYIAESRCSHQTIMDLRDALLFHTKKPESDVDIGLLGIGKPLSPPDDNVTTLAKISTDSYHWTPEQCLRTKVQDPRYINSDKLIIISADMKNHDFEINFCRAKMDDFETYGILGKLQHAIF